MSKDNNQFLRITPKSADDIIKKLGKVFAELRARAEKLEKAKEAC